jgi:hypothetical protein
MMKREVRFMGLSEVWRYDAASGWDLEAHEDTKEEGRIRIGGQARGGAERWRKKSMTRVVRKWCGTVKVWAEGE